MRELLIERFPFRTMPALLRHSASRVPTRRFSRELVADSERDSIITVTFAQFEQSVANTSEFLSQAGLRPFERILFLAENSLDYQVASLAAQSLRAEPAAVFSNLGATAACDIALRVCPRGIYVSTEEQWEKLSSVVDSLVASGLSLRISPTHLKPVPGLRDCHPRQMASTSCKRATWDERVDSVGPSDPFLLLFTSGTTGKQKGVILQQDAFVRAIEGGQSATAMTEADDGLMFLPFAHIAGQCQFMLAIALGHPLILVAQRAQLPQAFALGPTYSFAVPLVYEKLKEQVHQQLLRLPPPLRQLLLRAFEAASRPKSQQRTLERALSVLAERTLGKRLKETLGGRLRLLASGGAAADTSLSSFFEAMGLPFISLYGMSETCGLIASQCANGPRTPGTVGLPSSDLQLRFSANGELRLKGLSMMAGYLEEEDNRSAYDENGFFRTGDLASLDEETGELSLSGRSKSLLVLSTGKKLSPEPIEVQLTTLPHIGAAVLVGDARPYVSAILFVVPSLLRSLGKSDRAVVKSLHTALSKHLDEFSEYERPKRLLVIPLAPSDRPEFVTPTLKLKRSVILEAYASEIDRLYAAEDDAGMVVP